MDTQYCQHREGPYIRAKFWEGQHYWYRQLIKMCTSVSIRVIVHFSAFLPGVDKVALIPGFQQRHQMQSGQF